MQTLLKRTTTFLTPRSSTTDLPKSGQSDNSPPAKVDSSSTISSKYIFPTVDPLVDGPECLHDCSACPVQYPRKWSIDESEVLYGQVHGWATHVLIATGKTDWQRDVADEKGSVMEAIGRFGTELGNGRCMVSACNMPVSDEREEQEETQVLTLPKWEIVEDVAPARTTEFMQMYVSRMSTTTIPFPSTDELASPTPPSSGFPASDSSLSLSSPQTPTPPPDPTTPFSFRTRPCPHQALILLCSHKTRDARCGQSAPLLRREFERHLRPLGLYRDLQDDRPGGVGIYFISHVGGHKYAANVMVYRRGGFLPQPNEEEADRELSMTRNLIQGLSLSHDYNRAEENIINPNTADAAANINEAVQCIWLARVRPEDCEAIIKYTVLQGKVVKPERHLRGGFDRARGLTSW